MSNYTAIENNRILIDLTQAALATGWAVDGLTATHDSCNPGNLYLLDYPLTIGQAYKYSYTINYVNSGFVKTNMGANQSVSGLVTESIVATGAQLWFYANGPCQITSFGIQLDATMANEYSQNTIAFSERIKKWTSFYTYLPDDAFSMFTKAFLMNNGDIYVQEDNTPDRCNFFGVQYPATIWFSTNQQSTLPKTYHSVNYQANQLLITPPSGINTANGQVSELIPIDFIQQILADGVSPSIFQYQVEGIYKASFMRSFPDLINGDILQGRYMQIGLQTTAPSGILALFTTEITYIHSYANTR